MFVQSSSRRSQRNHWYVNVALVFHIPVSVLSCFPTPGDPFAMGGTVETGTPVAPLAVVAPSTTVTRATGTTDSRLRLATILHLPRTPIPATFREASTGLTGHAFEDSLGNVEVRVDLLHVVVLLELVDQAQDLLRLVLVLDGDGRLREHRQLGRLDLEAGALDRLAHRGELGGGGQHLEAGAVEGDVVGAALGRRQHQ